MACQMNLSPSQINEQCNEIAYRCRVCQTHVDLKWFYGTSCPVCKNPDCYETLVDEFNQDQNIED